MIKLKISINPDEILSNKARHDKTVSNSLKELADLVPNHKSDDFKSRLWKKFKLVIWEQQHKKCAFCEKEIVSSDDAQLEHFRPKAEACSEDDVHITREAYWWLAYDHKNFIVSCFTCNNIKGNRFPLQDEETRVTATDLDGVVKLTEVGSLGNEMPLLINPRYQDPEPYLAYDYRPDIRIVHVVPKDDNGIGEKTINILDLNRLGKNKDEFRDNLTNKRGNVLSEFKKELENFNLLKKELTKHRENSVLYPNNTDAKKVVDDMEINLNSKRDKIRGRFLLDRAQFSGMCSFWLKNDSDLENDLIEAAA